MPLTVSEKENVHYEKYLGGVLASNGHIYMVPHNANNVGDFDPVTGVLSALDISRVISGVWKYSGGVLSKNGHIYFVPRNANNVGDFDPATGAFSTVSIPGTSTQYDAKFAGGVLAPNGHIYFVPSNADSVGDFYPDTGTFSAIDISRVISHDCKYSGGVLAPNGHICMVPQCADSIGVLCLAMPTALVTLIQSQGFLCPGHLRRHVFQGGAPDAQESYGI